MPELPEVETVVRTIRPGLVGRTILKVYVGRKKLRVPWSGRWSAALVRQPVLAVNRRGKWIIVELRQGSLLGHLGMTGQLTIQPAERAIAPHTHLRLELDNGLQLRFRDERRFGSIQYFGDLRLLQQYLDARLGPEPFDLVAGHWVAALARSRRPIKTALLDQSLVAGVGNIYADESLFAARIHPKTSAHRLTPAQAEALRRTIAKVLARAIDHHGSSIRNYLDGTGERGQFQNEFRVYGRTDEPCRRCRTPIQRMRLAGRSTHFCPNCQARSRGRPAARSARSR